MKKNNNSKNTTTVQLTIEDSKILNSVKNTYGLKNNHQAFRKILNKSDYAKNSPKMRKVFDDCRELKEDIKKAKGYLSNEDENIIDLLLSLIRNYSNTGEFSENIVKDLHNNLHNKVIEDS